MSKNFLFNQYWGTEMFETKFRPNQVHPTVFIATGAVVVGDVSLAAEASVWFNSTLRGDTTPIIVGERTNIQEGSILHADPGYPAILGQGVTVGHGAVVHGATVGDNSLIGIRATLLNGVVVGENCLVGAGSLLTPGKQFPAGSLILGSPAKVIRALTVEEIAANRQTAEIYVKRALAFRE
ncbi:gamma carbonic anhydrase family protein [Anaerolineales bacterium HSG6]|nr:gamma carbonic anhydrase family protein [Anaerolineales bacterium HSG6]MDM8530589.1 gamma carbonic anhydrase family protein [Anaerolineales bacterium HSG25]